MKKDFDITKTEEKGISTYVFDKSGKADRMVVVFEGDLKFETGNDKKIVSNISLMFTERVHYSQNLVIRELVVRKMNDTELDTIKKRDEAIAANETNQKTHAALKAEGGNKTGTDLAKDVDTKRVELAAKIKIINDAMSKESLGDYATTIIRKHFSGLQNTVAAALSY